MNALQQAAVNYRRRGYSIIPVGPDKRPIIPEWLPYQKEPPSEQEIEAWFGGDTPPGIAIVCGTVSRGFTAVDLDDLDVAQAIGCDMALQRQTALVETPSGGCHAWLRQTEGVCRCHPLKDQDGQPIGDLKGDGGYVVVPPTPGYRFISKVAPLKVPDAWEWASATLKGVGVDLHRNGDKPRLDVADVLAHLQAPTGDRPGNLHNSFRSVAGRLIREGWGTEEIVALLMPHGDRAGADPAKLVELVADMTRRYAPADLPVAPDATPQESKGTLCPVTLAELRTRHSGEVTWIVHGYLARGELGFLAGAGESLKSWTAAHLAAAIDGRFKWLGVFDVAADRVLYIEQERAGNLVYQLNRIEVAERVTLGSDRLMILPPTSLPLSEPEAVADLEAVIVSFRPDIVIINALRDVLGRANENSPTDIAALLRPLGQLAERRGLCVLILDHYNKSGTLGGIRGSAAHAGTAQKYNEADVVLYSERPRDEMGHGIGPATVSVGKRRQGQEGAAFAVSVTDTEDGGVLVRAEVGVIALSPLAQALKGFLGDGPSTVAALSSRSGKADSSVREALSELCAARLVEGKPTPGKRAFTYSLSCC